MDKKKKIMVAAVGVVMALALVGYIKFIAFDDESETDHGNDLAIMLPSIDDKKIKETSKKSEYDKQEADSTSINAFMNDRETPEIDEQTAKNQRLEEELLRIMEMQKELDRQQQQIALQKAQMSQFAMDPSQISNLAQQLSNGLVNQVQNKIGKPQKNFYGAGFGTDNTVLDLVPAETVDQGVLINGSTIAIRTKESITLKSPPITIPKDAVVYGKVFFAGLDRMDIEIVSYKAKKKLYQLNLKVYDFDGREGVHLGNRSWIKIPSKVSKDVFEYGYQRGTQQSSFGGVDNEINLSEAKDVAILSATKEIAAELFDKRRVLLPRKYHLWINIRSNENESVN